MHVNRLLAGIAGPAGIVAALSMAIALAWLALRPPALPAAAADAGPAAFSAGRAMAHAGFLAQMPRPIASDANARARDYLLEKLRALGLDPQLQSATVRTSSVDAAGNVNLTIAVVHNILVRIAGSAPVAARRHRLMLASHYDSAPGSADAAGSVAALLEALRALRQGPPLRNNLMVLIADGEHAGALGTRAFAEQHPWARNVGLVLRFDGAGGSGPLMLVDTHGGNGHTVAAWARSDATPVGSSRLREAPWPTLGLAGMRFASDDGAPGMPAPIAPATLQHTGDTMLALARTFGAQPLDSIAAADSVYFNLPLAGLVHYPTRIVWHITRVACALLLAVCWCALRRGMSGGQLAKGTLAFVLMGGACALSAILLRHRFPELHGEVHLMACAALAAALLIGLARRIGLAATVLGAALTMALALIALSVAMPGASYLLAWPLIGMLMAVGAMYLPLAAELSRPARAGILAAGMAPAVMLLAPLAAAGSGQPDRHRLPQAMRTTYLADATSWKTYWLLPERPQDSRRLLPAPAIPRPLKGAAGARDVQWVTEAPPAGIAFPHVEIRRHEDTPAMRRIAFSLRSKNAAPTIELQVEGAHVLASRLDGAKLSGKSIHGWTLTLHGMGDRPLALSLDLEPGDSARVFIKETIPGLPADAGRSRPADTLLTDRTLATDMLVFR